MRSRDDLADTNPSEVIPNIDSVRLWDAPIGDSIRSFFKKVQSGNLVIFYDDDAYVGFDHVDVTFEDDERWAGTNYWQDASSSIESIISLAHLTDTGEPDLRLRSRLLPPGINRVADSRVTHSPVAIRREPERYDETH